MQTFDNLAVYHYYDQEEPKCSCLDSAFQRQALASGFTFREHDLFIENLIWWKKRQEKKHELA